MEKYAEAVESERMKVVEEVLAELVQSARSALGPDLLSVLLFGSAAEGRLRPNSDVNVLMLLKEFEPRGIDAMRESLRAAHAAARVETMFLLEDELPVAAELFAVKMNDMRARHRLLHGVDPLANLDIGEAELRRRLREVLLNQAIRLRERYALVSLREEQLSRVLGEAAGPLRAAAAALLQLQGDSAASPRAALERVAAATGDDSFVGAVALLPQARMCQTLAPGAGGPGLLALARLAGHLRLSLEGAAP